MTHGTTDYKDGLCRLTLDIVSPSDSATYTCKATAAAGSAETTATVRVKGQPSICHSSLIGSHTLPVERTIDGRNCPDLRSVLFWVGRFQLTLFRLN